MKKLHIELCVLFFSVFFTTNVFAEEKAPKIGTFIDNTWRQVKCELIFRRGCKTTYSDYYFVCAKKDNRIIAFTSFFEVKATKTIIIDQFVVLPEGRGKEIERGMLQTILRWFPEFVTNVEWVKVLGSKERHELLGLAEFVFE